jgi:putative ubiquitin-RnfH superfamily antitoxin RatB of RatAB toxin-antitoxin module
VALEHPLADGDRVEIYRPLAMDPKEARKRRAQKRAKGRR